MASSELNVISGEFLGWDDFLKNRIDLFIYMHLPVEVRIKRIQLRDEKRFGARILPGGDMYAAHIDFLEWVREYENGDETRRSVARHKKWVSTLKSPLLKIETPLPIEEILKQVEPYLK
jgi:hypothetical protein